MSAFLRWLAYAVELTSRPPARGALPPSPGKPVPERGVPLAEGPQPPRRSLAPAPAPHGDLAASIDVWEDGRTVTVYHRTGTVHVAPGECAECTGGAECHLCGLYPAAGVVWRYQRCPAHEPELQP
jgi:hypothetical protein